MSKGEILAEEIRVVNKNVTIQVTTVPLLPPIIKTHGKQAEIVLNDQKIQWQHIKPSVTHIVFAKRSKVNRLLFCRNMYIGVMQKNQKQKYRLSSNGRLFFWIQCTCKHLCSV